MLNKYTFFTLLIAGSAAFDVWAITPVRLAATSLGAGAVTYVATEMADMPKSFSYVLPGLAGAATAAALLRKDARNFQRYKTLISGAQRTIDRVGKDPLMQGINITPDLVKSGYDQLLMHSHIKNVCQSRRPFSEAQRRLNGLEADIEIGNRNLDEAIELAGKGGFIETGTIKSTLVPFITYHSDWDLYRADKSYDLMLKLGRNRWNFAPESLFERVMHQKDYVDKHLANLAKKAQEMDA